MRWFVKNSLQILLYSNVRQETLGVLVWTLKKSPLSYYSKFIIPINPQRAVDSAIYSALVVLSSIKYCILITHIIGKLA